jgi:hypothetical protein
MISLLETNVVTGLVKMRMLLLSLAYAIFKLFSLFLNFVLHFWSVMIKSYRAFWRDFGPEARI